MPTQRQVLHLAVKGTYFEQIKAGTKPWEYRLVTPHWRKRLEGRRYDEIRLTLGYPKAGDPERTLVLPWRGYQLQEITHPHFGSSPVQVFAIDVSPE